MIYDEYIIKQTNSLYEGYQRLRANLEEYANGILLENADYAEAKYALSACVFDLQKAIFTGDEQTAATLEREKASLEKRLDKIKNAACVITYAYRPHCQKCGDTGRYSGGLCDCYIKNLNAVAYEFLGVNAPALNTFADNAVSDETTIKRVEKFSRYCDNFSQGSKNLLFLGERGTGKTFFASAIADRLNHSGKNAVFLNAFQLNDVFIKFIRANYNDYEIYKNILTTCDLLVIDDLGAAPVLNKITAECLLLVISERQAAKKPFIVTTNYNLDEIISNLGERLFSRMCAKTTVKIPFEGKDLRIY